MSRVIIISILILLCIQLLYGYAFQVQGAPETSILILYQERSFFADRRDTVSAIETLLGHFMVEVVSLHVHRAKTIELHHYDYVMVIALNQIVYDDSLYERLVEYSGEIIWLGRGIEELLRRGSYLLEYEGRSYDFLQVSYKKGQTGLEYLFPIGVKREFCRVRAPSPAIEVYAWLTNGLEKFPYIAKDKNLYFVSRVDINEPLFYIFGDFLNDLFQKKYYREDVLLLSIEDVHAFRDYDSLRDMADYLHHQSIPFLIGLIPYVKQEGSTHVTKFSEITAFLETLRYMQSRGGRIVLQVLPLNIRNGTFTVESLHMDVADEVKYVTQYINMGIADCVTNGLYPIGVGSPYLHLQDESFHRLKESFSSFFGMLSITEENYIIFPFEVYDSPKFNRFYPYNLGYLETGNHPFLNIEEMLKKIGLVRGFMAGVYFHSYLPVEKLYELVGFLQREGLPFYDILVEEHWVKGKEYELFFTDRGVEVIDRYLDRPSPSLYQFSIQVSTMIQWILLMIILLFLILFNRSYRAFKKSLIKG